MNVQELIDKLQTIQDKTQDCFSYHGYLVNNVKQDNWGNIIICVNTEYPDLPTSFNNGFYINRKDGKSR